MSTYGYEVYLPDSGGKAGKGHNVTSSIQLRFGNCIRKQFRYRIDADGSGFRRAMFKAVEWAKANPPQLPQP